MLESEDSRSQEVFICSLINAVGGLVLACRRVVLAVSSLSSDPRVHVSNDLDWCRLCCRQ